MTRTTNTDALDLAIDAIDLWSRSDDRDTLLPLAVKAWNYIVDYDESHDSRYIESAQELIAATLLGDFFEYANAKEAAISADRTKAIDFTVDGWPIYLDDAARAELTIEG